MNINDIIRDTADTVKAIPIFAGIDVLEEDKGDIVGKLAAALAKTKPLAAIVGWNGFTPKVVGGTAPHGAPFGDVTVVVQIFEKPVVNRKNDANPRLLNLAQEVAKALDGAATERMDDVMHLKRISPVSELDRGVITCDVEFFTKASL